MFKKSQVLAADGTFDATHLFRYHVLNADNDCVMGNIDSFRRVFTTKQGTPTHSHAYPGFPDDKSNKSAFRGFEPSDDLGGTVNLGAAIPEANYDSRGASANIYNIFDTTKDATHGIRGRLDRNRAELRLAAAGDDSKFQTYSFNELTRVCFKVMDANSVANAVSVLYNNDFDEEEGFGKKKGILDKCLIAAQTTNNRGTSLAAYITQSNGTGDGANAEYSGWENFDKAYDALAEFFQYYDVDYSKLNKDEHKTQLETALTKLTVYQNANRDGLANTEPV